MSPRLYFRLLVLSTAVAAGCGGGEALQPRAPEAGVFALDPAERRGWLPPADEDWIGRWIEHLRAGSKEGLRFALERLREEGAGAGPTLAAEIRAVALDPSQFGLLVNLLGALGASGDASQVSAVAEVLRHHPTPVVRTAAAEAAAALRAPAAIPALAEAVERESEPAPRRGMLIAIARIGGEPAVRVLEQRARGWIAEAGEGGAAGDGGDSWNALMLVDGEELLSALLRLDAVLPPPLRVQALAARVELGDREVGPLLRPYLDADTYPSGKTRSLALAVLAELRDWEPVLAAAEDPALPVRRTVAGLLGGAAAVADGVGVDRLDAWSSDEDEELRELALAGLLAHGQRHRLDPLLQSVREFPLRPGSAEALLLLTEPELRDPRLAPLLVGRWDSAAGSHRMDLMRALVKIEAPQASVVIAGALTDADEDPSVRRLAAALIANFPDCVEPLLAWYREQPDGRRAGDLVAGLGRWAAEVPQARAGLLELAADAGAPDAARKAVFDALPLVFDFEALELLLGLRGREPRADVREYLDALLVRWF